MTGVHSSSRPTMVRSNRVLPWPRSPSSTMSWPASSARSTCGMTVSSKPWRPGQGSSPARSLASRLSRISVRSGLSSWPERRSSPRVPRVGAVVGAVVREDVTTSTLVRNGKPSRWPGFADVLGGAQAGWDGSVVMWRRVLAGVLAAFWGLVWFGLIDLLTAVLRDPDFTNGYALELGWGLFHLVLVAGPLVALVVRPRAGLPVAMLAVATTAVLIAALWGWSGRVALEGLGLLATTLLMGRPRVPRRRPALVPAALAVVALPFALWYAATWVNAM